jgi:chromate reductase, NAD(P)H dehydrogenase (quinone)
VETPTRRLLLVSGSTRGASTNTVALRTVAELAPDDVETELYDGLAALPAFNPDDDHDPLPETVARLRQSIAAADAVVFCTPEYAGALPGSFKNLLDWTVGGGEMDHKPVAWLHVAAEGRGDLAVASLATVLSYLGTVVVAPACVRAPLARDMVGPRGVATDVGFRAKVTEAVETVVAHLRHTDESSG